MKVFATWLVYATIFCNVDDQLKDFVFLTRQLESLTTQLENMYVGSPDNPNEQTITLTQTIVRQNL